MMAISRKIVIRLGMTSRFGMKTISHRATEPQRDKEEGTRKILRSVSFLYVSVSLWLCCYSSTFIYNELRNVIS
jgi:hypothetical protein